MWRPGAEAYVYGTAAIVSDVAEKQRLWARTDLPFDPSGFFGSADNPDHVLVKVSPTRATVMADNGNGISRHSWHA
jgi:general stress protein 26